MSPTGRTLSEVDKEQIKRSAEYHAYWAAYDAIAAFLGISSRYLQSLVEAETPYGGHQARGFCMFETQTGKACSRHGSYKVFGLPVCSYHYEPACRWGREDVTRLGWPDLIATAESFVRAINAANRDTAATQAMHIARAEVRDVFLEGDSDQPGVISEQVRNRFAEIFKEKK